MATVKKLAAAAAPLPPTAWPIGALIDGMVDARDRKRALEAQIKAVEAEYDELETALMNRLTVEQTDKGAGSKGSASITKTVTGNIVDYDLLCKFIKRTGYFHLFQRRISDPSYRELLESKGAVPGLESFTKTRINLRSL